MNLLWINALLDGMIHALFFKIVVHRLINFPSQQSRPVAKFAEDFDFMAMNEKFNKDEVWDNLGKSNGQFSDDPNEYEDNVLEDDVVSPGKPDVKVCVFYGLLVIHLCLC